MSSVFRMLKSKGHDTDLLWTNIQKVITKTVVSFTPQLKIELHAHLPGNKPGPQCFQVHFHDLKITINT